MEAIIMQEHLHCKKILPMKIRCLDGHEATTKVCSVEIYQPYSKGEWLYCQFYLHLKIV